jgi:rRNA maturation RNase YbeY
MINFEFLEDEIDSLVLSQLNNLVSKIINHYNFSEFSITVVCGSDEWLLELNKQFLKHDYYTDIITFNYNENSIIAGDLCVSLERVAENASNYGVSRETEFSRVVIHGVLHLCGLNDKTDEDIANMRKTEDFFLDRLYI